MKISDNFDIRELVHPDIYNHPAIGVRCVDFIHVEAAPTLEAIKKATNDVITVNDWLWKGVDAAHYTNSGLRLPSGSVGAGLSSHKFGCGFDLKFKHLSPQEAHAFILANQHLFPNITRMEAIEKTPSWVHIEIGERLIGDGSVGGIVVFNP
jgi:hypothetical protein